MRKLFSLIAGTALVFALFALTSPFSSLAEVEGLYLDGVYEGSADGNNGLVKVKVSIKDGYIDSIDVLEQHETPMLGDTAMEQVSAAIIETQCTDVDSVTGATVSSKAIQKAVAAALVNAATGNTNTTAKKNSDSNQAKTYSADVLVIGAGGAGLTAAVEAARAGADVVVLEKMPMVGGNTTRATGGMNAAGTKFQGAKGIEDTAETHFEDTMKGGYQKNNPSLVRLLTGYAAQAVEWLVGLGADLSDVGRLGGASQSRAHRPSGGGAVGSEVVKTLYEEAKNLGVTILANTKATELLTQDGKVTGARAIEKDSISVTVNAKAVVLATGGFGANQELISEIVPRLAGFGTTNHPGATGDGIDLAKNVGADFVDLDQIQTHPTVVPEIGVMITEAVRGNGAILVSRDGTRFVDELNTRDVVSEAILMQKGKTAFLVFEDGVRGSLSAIEKYAQMGLLTEGKTAAELATKLGMPAETLVKSIEGYNQMVVSGIDAQFGRTSLPRQLTLGSFYAVEVGPAVHHTMGGVKINEEAQVLDTTDAPISGLYAAGEITGGVHGGNRLGGNAVVDIVVFGRIAGQNASDFVK